MGRALLAVGLAAWAMGCTERPDHGRAVEPVTNATDDDGDPAIVAVVGAPLGCSGTLVHEQAVLTAGHCLVQEDPAAVRVFFGSRVGGEGTFVSVRDAVAHPELDDTADYDLALLWLTEPAPVAPVSMAAEPLLGATPPVPVRLVGFGVTGADAGDDGRKREGTSQTTEVTPWHVVLGADPSLPCLGDSGGPVLVASAEGEQLGAVVSRGDAACGVQGKATRVDVHLEDFVRPQIEAWERGELRGLLGDSCGTDADCLRGDCLSDRATCSIRCVAGRGDCPAGFACEHLGGVDFYCVAPEPDPGCCATTRSRRERPDLLLLAVGLLVVARRRRR